MDLVRCALTPDGRAVVDRHAPGRGAWLCAATAPECCARAVRSGAFARAWRRPVEPGALAALADGVEAFVRGRDEKG